MSPPLETIIVAVDGSPDARLAARAAASLSGKTGAGIHIVHAWQSVPHPVIDSHYYEEGARRLLREESALVTEAGGTVRETHLVMGSPVDAVLDVAEGVRADLSVIGSRGHGTLGRLLLGSVSEGVVHHATRPVLVLRGGEHSWPPGRVIIGDDGSEAARIAGKLAAGIGGVFGAVGVLLRAYPELPKADLAGRSLDPRAVDDALRRAELTVRERARGLGLLLGRPLRVVLASGEPAVTLLGEAREGDESSTLIAVGSRGLGPARRLTLGSVSTKVLRAAGGAVLVCPTGAG